MELEEAFLSTSPLGRVAALTRGRYTCPCSTLASTMRRSSSAASISRSGSVRSPRSPRPGDSPKGVPRRPSLMPGHSAVSPEEIEVMRVEGEHEKELKTAQKAHEAAITHLKEKLKGKAQDKAKAAKRESARVAAEHKAELGELQRKCDAFDDRIVEFELRADAAEATHAELQGKVRQADMRADAMARTHALCGVQLEAHRSRADTAQEALNKAREGSRAAKEGHHTDLEKAKADFTEQVRQTRLQFTWRALLSATRKRTTKSGAGGGAGGEGTDSDSDSDFHFGSDFESLGVGSGAGGGASGGDDDDDSGSEDGDASAIKRSPSTFELLERRVFERHGSTKQMETLKGDHDRVIAELEEKNRTLEGELAEERQRAIEDLEERQRAAEDHDRLIAELGEKTNTLELELVALRARLADSEELEKKTRVLESELVALRARLADSEELEKKTRVLESELVALRARLADTKVNWLSELKKKTRVLESELVALRARLADSEDGTARLRVQTETLQSERVALEEHNKLTVTTLEKKTVQREAAAESRFTAATDQQRRNVDSLEENVRRLQVRLESSEADRTVDVERRDRTIGDLEQGTLRMRSQVDAAKDERTQMLAKHARDVDELDCSVRRQRSEAEEAESQRAGLVDRHERSALEFQRDRQRMQSQLEVGVAERRTLEERHERVLGDITEDNCRLRGLVDSFTENRRPATASSDGVRVHMGGSELEGSFERSFEHASNLDAGTFGVDGVDVAEQLGQLQGKIESQLLHVERLAEANKQSMLLHAKEMHVCLVQSGRNATH